MRGVAPAGDLDRPPLEFHWTSDSRAYVYRIDVYDSEARFLFGSTTKETTAVAPVAAISWPEHGYWQVTSLSSAGTKLAESEPIRFHIVP